MKIYPASLSKRFWAMVIDLVAMSMIMSCVIVPMGYTLSNFDAPDWLWAIMGFIVVGLYLFYLPLCETFFNGRTLGKMCVGTRVVRTDGSPASGVSCFQRYMMLFIDLGTVVGGMVSIMVTKRSQRLGDLVADTVVVIDRPQQQTYEPLMRIYNNLSQTERDIYMNTDIFNSNTDYNDPLALAQLHRSKECQIAQLRTAKGHSELVDHVEAELSHVHMRMFRHKAYTMMDMITFTLRSIPRAVYESRWCVLAALALAVVGIIIGVFSQCIDPDFFSDLIGSSYSQMTIENIKSGKPMGVYASENAWRMFFSIFSNNSLVSLHCYVYGIFPFIGPAFYLLNNFAVVGTWVTFFAQQGHFMESLITINQHGILELASIIMAGGAAMRFGTGWLFPGKLTRLKAWARSCRQSLLILLSTLPVLFVAAFIESFITRHVEWPIGMRAGVLIITSIFIIVYYVVLPFLSKDK